MFPSQPSRAQIGKEKIAQFLLGWLNRYFVLHDNVAEILNKNVSENPNDFVENIKNPIEEIVVILLKYCKRN